MDLSPAGLIGNLLFSGIGFLVFRWGKHRENAQLIGLGIALMAYSYFVPSTLWLYVVGAGLSGAAWLALD
jgi:hypothetical protein